jgi:hypothetical protein
VCSIYIMLVSSFARRTGEVVIPTLCVIMTSDLAGGLKDRYVVNILFFQ